MLFKYKDNTLEPLPYYDYKDLNGKEKDLENLLASNLNCIYAEAGQLMPIFQEHNRQEEPDLCALDKDGNLVIFELKRGIAQENTTIQLMRYAQVYGQKKYTQLNHIFKKYAKTSEELKYAHAETFGLGNAILNEAQFNKNQKLVIVGSSSDIQLMEAVGYWKSKHLDIDFLPYRFYKIGGDIYFDFFAKPYDFHINPRDKKGILFDTNRSHNKNSVWDMFSNSKISAYGSASRYINSFNKGDYVLYYHKGFGVIGAGIIKTSSPKENPGQNELYHTVNLLTPAINTEKDIRYISASELCSLLDKNFYFASTIKSPYLSPEEAELVIKELKGKYQV